MCVSLFQAFASSNYQRRQMRGSVMSYVCRFINASVCVRVHAIKGKRLELPTRNRLVDRPRACVNAEVNQSNIEIPGLSNALPATSVRDARSVAVVDVDGVGVVDGGRRRRHGDLGRRRRVLDVAFALQPDELHVVPRSAAAAAIIRSAAVGRRSTPTGDARHGHRAGLPTSFAPSSLCAHDHRRTWYTYQPTAGRPKLQLQLTSI